MLKFAPLILAIAYALAMYHFSVWRTRQMLDRQSHPLRDPELLALTARLAEAQGIATLTVHVFDVPQVNGLAAPDGRIFLTQGFVQKYRDGAVSAEELASVIAHELGHVALGHTRRRMVDVTGANALFVMLTALLSRFVPLIGALVANALASALMARLSRKAEFEADAYASALLIKAGIGTEPQASLFAKLAALTGQQAEPPAWLRSHPSIEDRIAAIQANARRWQGLTR